MAIGYKVVKGSATKARARRHFRLRKRVSGTAQRPRLVVSRSARHLFVQVVDDTTSTTLAYASTMAIVLTLLVAIITSALVYFLTKREVER